MLVSCPKYSILMQKTWIVWLRKMKLFSHVDEVLSYKRPENKFFLSGAIHCENAILNIQIFAFNLHLDDLFNSSSKSFAYKSVPLFSRAQWNTLYYFQKACCRQYEMGECVRAGFCNFMHLKPISRELRRDLYGR